MPAIGAEEIEPSVVHRNAATGCTMANLPYGTHVANKPIVEDDIHLSFGLQDTPIS